MPRSVPFHRPSIGEEEIAEVVDSLRSGWLTTGPKVERFQRQFAAAVSARHAVALTSATAALHLALEAVGVTLGDEVIIPAIRSRPPVRWSPICGPVRSWPTSEPIR